MPIKRLLSAAVRCGKLRNVHPNKSLLFMMNFITLIHIMIIQYHDIPALFQVNDIQIFMFNDLQKQYYQIRKILLIIKSFSLIELLLISINRCQKRSSVYVSGRTIFISHYWVFYLMHLLVHSTLIDRLYKKINIMLPQNKSHLLDMPGLYYFSWLYFVYPLIPILSSLIKAFQSSFHIFKKFIAELNESTLSCASDIIVIEDENGKIMGSTPFLIRFGFLSIIRPNNNLVKISVNDTPTNIEMYLQPNGSAYFFRNSFGINEEPHHQNNQPNISFENGHRNESRIFRELNKMYLHLKNINDIQRADSDKTIYLKHEHLKNIGLKPNQNDITFEVNNSFLGKRVVKSTIFLWNVNDKIIISDVDGTITKSDVIGHVVSLCSSTRYIQKHLIALYNAIEKQNYRFVYLTMRFHGYQNLTRKQIIRWNANKTMLPAGALAGSPLGLSDSMKLETLMKKSDILKGGILQILKNSFGHKYNNNIYAGFGNTKKDKIAYFSIGINPDKVFIIDRKGRIRDGENKALDFTFLEDSISEIFPIVS